MRTTTDTKALVMRALGQALGGVPVVSRRPDADGAPLGEVVLVIATGGAGRSRRVLHTGQVTIDCYGPTTGKAMALALRVDAAMRALTTSDQVPVTRVTGSAPAESPDPDTHAARTTATYQVTTRNHS